MSNEKNTEPTNKTLMFSNSSHSRLLDFTTKRVYSANLDLISKIITGASDVLSIGWTAYNTYERLVRCLMRTPESARLGDMSLDDISKESPEIRDEIARIIHYCNLNSTGSVSYARLAEMFDQYNTAIYRKGIVCDPEAFTGFDMVDATEFIEGRINGNLPDETDYEEVVCEYTNKNKFFSYIPCFQRGIMRIREDIYVEWEYYDLNFEDQTFVLSCSMYFDHDIYHCSKDIPVSEVTATAEYVVEKDEFVYKDITYITLDELYGSISPKKMKWNKDERLAWNQTFMRMIRLINKVSKHPAPLESSMDIMDDVIFSFAAVNCYLHRESQSRRVAKSEGDPDEVIEYNNDAQNARKTIHIGPIDIMSVAIPTEYAAREEIRYQVASWSVRGHTRHCKNGKDVYVRPHTKHRKGMEAIAKHVDPAPRTIKIDTGQLVNEEVASG